MITSVIVKRDFVGSKVSQRTGDSFFNATELLDIWNKANPENTKILAEFWANKSTQEFIQELEKDMILNIGNSLQLELSELKGVSVKPITHEAKKGRYGGTWMHPYLFVKFCTWVSTKFELQVIKWVYDNLIQFRCDAGDFYKEMMDSLKDHNERNRVAFNPLCYADEATMLNLLVFNSQKAKQRTEATEKELNLMNELQKYNIILLQDNVPKNDRLKLLGSRKNIYLRMLRD
jgi:hypothetical protein